MLQQCPVKWIPHHVLGHQDDDSDAFLDRWTTLNIEMDEDAKVHWAETVDKPRYTVNSRFPRTLVSLVG
jgi:hypothetical protein